MIRVNSYEKVKFETSLQTQWVLRATKETQFEKQSQENKRMNKKKVF